MRVLITGGTGFIGATLARHARSAGHAVVTLDTTSAADIRCDLGDAAAAHAAVLDAHPDALVHLAARLTDTAERNIVDAVRTNALGTAALFTAAQEAGVGRVIYASSIAAVGPCAARTGDATSLSPRTIYGATKAFGEHLGMIMFDRPDAPRFLALRFGWIYGPGRVRGWRDLQDMIERVANGERFIEFPDYADPIDWTWVDDVADILTRSLACPLAQCAAVNAVGDSRRVADAVAHLRLRFPDLVAQPVAATAPPSAWGLVNDGLPALIGPVRMTPLEEGLDRLLAVTRVAAEIPQSG